jgi:hypothetical protein
VILQETLFTEKECKDIIEYRKKYTDYYVTPTWSLLDGTRTVYHKEQNFDGIKYHEDKVWVKKYNVWDIPINDETYWFYDRLYTWFSNSTGISIDRDKYFNKDFAAHKLHEYVIGDRFDLHIDKSQSSLDRIWNLGIQLNSDYEGGDYICYDLNKNPIHISKVAGTVVAYTSDVLHEISEITKGIRYSMVVKLHSWELFEKNKKTMI